MSPRTTSMIEFVSACGWSYTAPSTAIRGRVTRRSTPRNMRSDSQAVGTRHSISHFLESLKYRDRLRPAADAQPDTGQCRLARRAGTHGFDEPSRVGRLSLARLAGHG